MQSKVTTYHWTPEQIAEHCKRIGADRAPEDAKKPYSYEQTIERSSRGGRATQTK